MPAKMVISIVKWEIMVVKIIKKESWTLKLDKIIQSMLSKIKRRKSSIWLQIRELAKISRLQALIKKL